MTPQPSQVRIWWDTSVAAYRLSSPYSSQLVDLLKTKIPVSDRAYDPQTKMWTFIEKWLAPTEGFCKLLGMATHVITRAQAEAAQRPSGQAVTNSGAVNPVDKLCIDFMRLLPFDAAQAAYRKAAMLLHPDRGGDMEKMSQLNATWQRLEKDLFKQ